MNNDHFEELAFPYLFPTGKFGCKVKHKVSLSFVKYFKQGILNFRQSFVLDADFIFLEDYLRCSTLRCPVHIFMHTVQDTELSPGSLIQNY